MGFKMKILFISDAHLGYNFETNFELVRRIISKTKPDVILSAGDWDLDVELIKKGVTKKKFQSMFNGIPVYSILGNHDNETGEITDLINSLKNKDGSNIFFEGLLETGKLTLLGMPINFSSEYFGSFIRQAIQYRRTKPDVLIIHDCLNNYINVIDWIIQIVQPKIILCGHVHDRPFYHEEREVFVKTGDPLCGDAYKKLTAHLFKVITTIPYGGYAVINYNPNSREVVGFSLQMLGGDE